MSIISQARAGALAAFNAAGDAIKSATLKLGPTLGAYNATTDAATITWEQNSANLRCLPYDDESAALAKPEARTRSFVFLGIEVTAGRPNQTGEIICESVTYQIFACESDPTKSVWTFHCTS